MAVLLTAKDLCLEWPTKTVLDGVTLGVSAGERIGIVGANGDGKSTLLRTLSGRLQPDSGEVVKAGNLSIGMLEQRVPFSAEAIVGDIIASTQTDSYTWEADRAAREIVATLLGDVPLEASLGTLSGGQQRRVDLARLLIGRWDLLMLDEPTNHLDISAINWLARHLKRRWPAGAGGLLVVTHDRWFLDEVCERMWEVHDGQVDSFEGGYSAYIMKRVERDRLEALARRKRANQLRKELAFLSRGAQARRSKPKFHVEAAAALIADVPPVRNPLELKQMAVARLGKQVLELNDVCVDRDGLRVLSDITWNIGPGERIGILGENGAGKTTLLSLLNTTLRPTLGHMKVGRTVKFATLSQNLDELAPIEDDVVRVVLSRYKTYYQVEGRKLSPTALLERMGFSRNQLNARVRDLSGGQRRRFQLLLILLDEPNVLVLDEPGNDLDTDMLAAMEDLLDSWPGTLIAVSHDRYFIERATDDQYAILDKRIRHVPGGVDEYLRLLESSKADVAAHERRGQAAMRQHGGQAARSPAAGAGREPSAQRTSGSPAAGERAEGGERAGAMGNAELRELKKQLRSAERRMSTARRRLEERRAELEACDPFDFEALGEAQAAIEEARGALEAIEDEWLELSERLG